MIVHRLKVVDDLDKYIILMVRKLFLKKRPDGKRVKDYMAVDKINLQAWIQFQKYADIHL